MNHSDEHFERLLAQVVDGNAHPNEWEQMQNRLLSDSDYRKRVSRYLIDEALLVAELRAVDAERTGKETADASGLARLLNAEESPTIPQTPHPFLTFQHFLNQINPKEHPLRFFATSTALTILCVFCFLSIIWPHHDNNLAHLNRHARQPFVARLSDAYDLQWAKGTRQDSIKKPLQAGSELKIASGLLKISFRSGANVLLEGPSTFVVDDANAGTLTTGRLTAYVPPSATGFTVHAENMKIIDRGTRFGMQVLENGQGDLIVFEGSVDVISSTVSGTDKLIRLATNQSLHFSEDGSVHHRSHLGTETTQTLAESFKHRIPVRETIRLDLADIVGGGDGKGSGSDQGIDMRTGKVAIKHDAHNIPEPWNVYVPVLHNSFVDGVFIPHVRKDNGPQEIQVSSSGHTVTGIINEKHATWDHIWNGYNIGVNHTPWNSSQPSILGIHASKGVTFDLGAMEQAYPDSQATQFTGQWGTGNSGSFKAYVIVDGSIVWTATDIPVKEPKRVQISLDQNARFLTVMATGYGWVMLADPEITLKRTKQPKHKINP